MAQPNGNPNRIQGTRSALTDYLASYNISARDIQQVAEQRAAAARREAQQAATRRTAAEDDEADGSVNGVGRSPARVAQNKRKKAQQKAVADIKKKKQLQRKRKHADPDEDEDYDDFHDTMRPSRPLPGQLDNCELCGKRFTVTAYSKSGPHGGLLCSKCAKELEAEKKNEKPQKKVARTRRRQTQSDLLDGIVRVGAKSLQDLCVEKVAAHVLEIEDFGDLPDNLLDRLSQILSKNRMLDSSILNLFVKPYVESVALYDCAKLSVDDYKKIFAVAPKVKKLTLLNAGQFKNEIVDYIVERRVPISELQIHAANLISDEKWATLLTSLGNNLISLKLAWLDHAFHDDNVKQLTVCCPNIRRLKFKQCFNLGEESLKAISNLWDLTHLTFATKKPVSNDILANLLNKVGPKLQTLSLHEFSAADDSVLATIHEQCRHLYKFGFTGNGVFTDAGFTRLFSGWTNPSLHFVNLSSSRHVDAHLPGGPDEPVGLASNGFKALFAHSGSRLEKVDISSCRHISHHALYEVFCGSVQYPFLEEMDLSFLTHLDTTIVAGIFQSCPKLRKLVIFGCFNVTSVKVPARLALIGLPTAQEPLVINGSWD